MSRTLYSENLRHSSHCVWLQICDIFVCALPVFVTKPEQFAVSCLRLWNASLGCAARTAMCVPSLKLQMGGASTASLPRLQENLAMPMAKSLTTAPKSVMY